MWTTTRFHNRIEAGWFLAAELEKYANRTDVQILALPRGGVPVAFEVAMHLNLPLDVFLVRKLGVPGQEELAFGAIASHNVCVLNENIVNSFHLSNTMIQKVIKRERQELERRERLYRGEHRPPLNVKEKTVIVVDDGLATGATMRAAIRALKKLEPKEIVVAVPVSSHCTCEEMKQEADVFCVCTMTPEPFYGVGMWYQDFAQTTDEEVIKLLSQAESAQSARHQVI